MRYSKTKPCDNCPFRRDIRSYLSKGRPLEFEGVEFSCHKTVDYSHDDGGRNTKKTEHCAGSLILHEKINKPHQMMRIMERIGFYDRTKLDMDAPVFDSFEEMNEAQL